MPQRQNKKIFVLVILLVWFAIFGTVYARRQDVFDWLALRGYQASPRITQLAGQDSMTTYARKIFYVNHPGIDTKVSFNSHCPNNGGERTIVLGCYHSDQAGIFLLDVSDPRLDGVEQVTAAHEMLHAAYDRLSGAERNKVDAMLMDYFNHDLHDPRLITTIAAYKKTEPHDVVNEMHSVFGTEVANLPTGLEQYYQRYFTNRPQVVAFVAQYQAEFTSRQATVATDDAKLGSLKSQIDHYESDLAVKQTQINSEQNQLSSERASDPSAYNSAVPGYNAQVNVFNDEIQTVQSLVNQYNQLLAARNAIVLEENQLVNDLSASPVPIKQK